MAQARAVVRAVGIAAGHGPYRANCLKRALVTQWPLARRYFDKVAQGETIRIYRNGRPIGDLVPIPARQPAWKNPPGVRTKLKGLRLGDEIVADRDKGR